MSRVRRRLFACDVNTPCDPDKPINERRTCNLDRQECIQRKNTFTSDDIIETKINGNRYIGLRETIHSVLTQEFGPEFQDGDITCNHGFDVINFIDFTDKKLVNIERTYEQPTDLISFVDVNTRHIHCFIREQLVKFWREKYDDFLGFQAPKLNIDDVLELREQKSGERDFFYTIDFRDFKVFINENTKNMILGSKQYIFLMYSTQFLYYDMNVCGISVYHNVDIRERRLEREDYIYEVLPIGPERELIENEGEVIIEWLKSLDIHYDYIEQVVSLHLEGMTLESIPDEIGDLYFLEYLSLSKNNLSSIPFNIGQLSNLRYLYLNENELTDIPASLTSLHSLNQLFLSNNKFEYFPENLYTINEGKCGDDYLQTLDVRFNPLSELTSAKLEVLNTGPYERLPTDPNYSYVSVSMWDSEGMPQQNYDLPSWNLKIRLLYRAYISLLYKHVRDPEKKQRALQELNMQIDVLNRRITEARERSVRPRVEESTNRVEVKESTNYTINPNRVVWFNDEHTRLEASEIIYRLGRVRGRNVDWGTPMLGSVVRIEGGITVQGPTVNTQFRYIGDGIYEIMGRDYHLQLGTLRFSPREIEWIEAKYEGPSPIQTVYRLGSIEDGRLIWTSVFLGRVQFDGNIAQIFMGRRFQYDPNMRLYVDGNKTLQLGIITDDEVNDEPETEESEPENVERRLDFGEESETD